MSLSLLEMSEQNVSVAEAPPSNDLALVNAARRDPRAFAALYEKYVTRIYRYCFARLGNQPAAEDATSQVFLKALQALPQFRDGMFIAWLYRIAHNVVTDMLRRAPPPTADLDSIEHHAHTADSPEDQAIYASERAAFYRALNDLPEEQRTVLELTTSGFKGEEIARILGKTHAAVKMLRWRGVRAIQSRVAAEGFLSEVDL